MRRIVNVHLPLHVPWAGCNLRKHTVHVYSSSIFGRKQNIELIIPTFICLQRNLCTSVKNHRDNGDGRSLIWLGIIEDLVYWACQQVAPNWKNKQAGLELAISHIIGVISSMVEPYSKTINHHLVSLCVDVPIPKANVMYELNLANILQVNKNFRKKVMP